MYQSFLSFQFFGLKFLLFVSVLYTEQAYFDAITYSTGLAIYRFKLATSSVHVDLLNQTSMLSLPKCFRQERYPTKTTQPLLAAVLLVYLTT